MIGSLLVYVTFITFPVRLFLGGILLAAGTKKMVALVEFARVIESYKILPKSLVRPFAYTLPYIEITLGIFLIFGFGVQFIGLTTALVFTSFALAIGVNLLRGQEVECHCFGKGRSEKISLSTFFRSIALTLLAIQVTFFTEQPLTLDNLLFHSSQRYYFTEILGVMLLLLVIVGLTILITFARQTLIKVSANSKKPVQSHNHNG